MEKGSAVSSVVKPRRNWIDFPLNHPQHLRLLDLRRRGRELLSGLLRRTHTKVSRILLTVCKSFEAVNMAYSEPFDWRRKLFLFDEHGFIVLEHGFR